MSKTLRWGLLLLVVGVSRPCLGLELFGVTLEGFGAAKSPPCACPDDYRRKCPPSICPPRYCRDCDDYRPKCAPRICLPSYCSGCDDYRPKCSPAVGWPCRWPADYKCAAPICCPEPAIRGR